MSERLAADVILLLHCAFVLFVVLGGLLVLRWPRLALAHLPAAVWGALVEWMGWICPLTPLEVALERAGGEAGYGGGFIEHYLVGVLYPEGLTREVQFALGAGVVLCNVAIYALVLRRARRRRRA